jgi:hypothetical protein
VELTTAKAGVPTAAGRELDEGSRSCLLLTLDDALEEGESKSLPHMRGENRETGSEHGRGHDMLIRFVQELTHAEEKKLSPVMGFVSDALVEKTNLR